MGINKTKLYDNFINIKNIANINLLVCYKLLFSIKGIIKNYGAYFLIPIIIIHYTFIIIVYGKNLYNNIKRKIKNITFALKNRKLILQERKEKEKSEILTKEAENKYKNSAKNKKLKIGKKEDKKIKEETKTTDNFKGKTQPKIGIIINNEPPKKNNKKNKKFNFQVNNINIDNIDKKKNNKKFKYSLLNMDKKNKNKENNGKNKKTIESYSSNLQSILKKTKNAMEKNDNELNDLPYLLALKFDKRSYCHYYISLIKIKHIFFFTFCNNNDYNIKLIKYDLFFVGFTLFCFVNTLFFSDETMHKIYKDNGTFNFIYQLPQILYSSLISSVINALLKILALSEKSILEYKSLKDEKKTSPKNFDKIEIQLHKKLKIRFAFYFIISSIFLLFFWYYISMFCVIYVNTQIHLIKDILISYSLSLFYPFAIYLLPGIFRILSLKNSKRKYLYKISKIVQLI